ncbi:hypothetical protein [Paenibacillus daejeonensis]|uniref:hypothetical protein n=1 Tax=Paenibacillus daejeonensis TaxID=135193 RepID=UPI00037693E1|nr:hypothetical protein [Paenibacillus daejeonensis]
MSLEQLKLALQRDSQEATPASVVQTLLTELSVTEKIELHTYLTDDEMARLVQVLPQLELPKGIDLDHLLIRYFKDLLNEVSDSVPNSMFDEIMRVYGLYPHSLSAVSICITLIRSRTLNEEQVNRLKEQPDEKHIPKELFILEMEQQAQQGHPLNGDQVSELLRLKAFDFLKTALEHDWIGADAMALFVKPAGREENRKHKEALYQLAQKRL